VPVCRFGIPPVLNRYLVSFHFRFELCSLNAEFFNLGRPPNRLALSCTGRRGGLFRALNYACAT
jgi:hypothetical protein